MSKNQTLLLVLTFTVLVVAGGFFLFRNNQTCCAANTEVQVQALAPTAYQQQFVSANTGHLLLDVRTPEEFTSGHIPGAVNISVQTLESRLNEVPRDQPIVVYCRSGNRSATAAQLLLDAGYTNVYDMGGIVAWTEQGLPVE